jgi:hypothetical protein
MFHLLAAMLLHILISSYKSTELVVMVLLLNTSIQK